MATAIELAQWIALSLSAVAAVVGGLCWWLVRPSRAFWLLARTAQGGLVLVALLAGAGWLVGTRPEDGLYYVYALMPVAVSSVAEQLRLAAADHVLARRDLLGVDEMRALDQQTQSSIVLEIVRRELGVVALALAVCAGLLARACSYGLS